MDRPEPYQLLDSWPDIRDQKIIGYDVETEDLGLQQDKGPGALRGEGKLLGIGISTNKFKHYFPVGHEDGQNYDINPVRNYLNDMLRTDIPKVGANIPYDMEWSYVNGIFIKGPIRDIQIAEPMLDEERPGGYSLQRLAMSYLGKGKDEILLKLACQIYGIKYKTEKEIKQHLKKFAPEFVAPYCIEDATLAIEVYEKQIPLIRDEEMWDIFMLECKLIPILLEMKIFGVRVDVERAAQLDEELISQEEELSKLINLEAGFKIDGWSNHDVLRYFEEKQLPFKKTKGSKKNPDGSPSFPGEFLASHEDKVPQMIARWRKINTMRVRYVEDILKYEHRGRVHSCIHQLASDDKDVEGKESTEGGGRGTKSGRMSYSRFSLQRIPKRDPEWKPIVRSMFLPEEGCKWGQKDYSQQEPRLGVHYSALRKMPGAQKAVDYYHKPGSCFHTMVAEMANIDRNTKAKTLNLGSWYGMGIAKMLIGLGGDTKENREVYKKYHIALPFVKPLLKDCMKFAEQRGYVKTILGRRAHFKSFTPIMDWDEKQANWKRFKPTRIEAIPERVKELQLQIEKIQSKIDKSLNNDLSDLDKAELNEEVSGYERDILLWESGRYERTGTYKALNRVIQGGAADQTKKSIADIYDYFGHVRYIQIQVHDELDGSYDNMEDLHTCCEIMQNAIKLIVPVVVEPEVGDSWGSVKKIA